MTREERMKDQMRYKPYTWEERNQFFYPKIEDREKQVSEILHRDSIVGGKKKPERYAEFHFGEFKAVLMVPLIAHPLLSDIKLSVSEHLLLGNVLLQ